MQARSTLNPFTARLAGRMMWWLYNTGILLGLFLLWPLSIALAAGQRKRRQTFRQRLGWWKYPWQFPGIPTKPTIWVHALSVGEVTAAQPLIQGLEKRYADHRIVLTASTLTGYETACRLFADSFVELAYFPFDLLFSVQAISRKIDPVIVLLIETDIWPNFLCEMQRRRVPVFLSNFRLSDSTWRRCRSVKRFAGSLFNLFEKIFVQNKKDDQRLQDLGVAPQRIRVTGNLKFDTAAQYGKQGIARHWQHRLGIDPDLPMVVAGSTHEGDEAVLIEALMYLRRVNIPVKLIIAPRDPGRSGSIVTLCADRGLGCRKLSALQPNTWPNCPDVVVVDFIGVLKEIYAVSTVAFIGGSLSHEGGHNPLEPAAHGKPVLFGPDMRDFHQIAAWLLEMKGARQVEGIEQLGCELLDLFNDVETVESMGRQALAVYKSHKGAVARTLDHLGLD